MEMHRLAPVGSLTEGEIRPFTIGDKYLVLVQGEEGPALVDGLCPHAGTDLVSGTVVGNRLRCATHRFFFDLKTGGCAVGRREGWGPLRVYELQELDGYICVDLAV